MGDERMGDGRRLRERLVYSSAAERVPYVLGLNEVAMTWVATPAAPTHGVMGNSCPT